jgi:hypothetical protein
MKCRVKVIFATFLLIFFQHVFWSNALTVEAQISSIECPVDWTQDGATTFEPVIAPENDTAWYDIHDLNFNYTFSATERRDDAENAGGENSLGLDIGVSVETDARSTIFTRIFSNMFSVVYPYITEDINDIANVYELDATRDDWYESFCLYGADGNSRDGKFSLELNGTNTYIVREDEWCIRPREGQIGEDGPCYSDSSDCDADLATRSQAVYECERNDTTGPYEEGEGSEVSTDTVNIPYATSLRALARKVAVRLDEQYCASSEDCLNDNYECIDFGSFGSNGVVAQFPSELDPDAYGRDGTLKTGRCLLTEDASNLSSTELLASDWCTIVNPNQALDTLDSKICHYGDLEYSAGTSEYMRTNLSISDSDQTGNQIPFDTELFKYFGEGADIEQDPNCILGNRGADYSQCQADGYFRSALREKLSDYSEEDQEALFEGLSHRIQVGVDTAYNVSGDDQEYDREGMPDAWTFDYIEKLGGYAMLSEEARKFNPYLLPSGNFVLSENNNEVVIRGNNVMFNNYILTNRRVVDINGQQVADLGNVIDYSVNSLTSLSDQIEQVRQFVDNRRYDYEECPADQVCTVESTVIDRSTQYIDAVGNLTSPFLEEKKRAMRAYLDSVVADLVGDRDVADQKFDEYVEIVRRLKNEVEKAFTYENLSLSYSPIVGFSNDNYLISYLRGGDIHSAISVGGRDVNQVYALGLNDVFYQVPFRTFLTSDGVIVAVYAKVDQTYFVRTYDVVNREIQDVNTGIDSLASISAFFEENGDDKTLHLAYLEDDDLDIVQYRRYGIGSGGRNSSIVNTGGPGEFPLERPAFTYFRPAIAMTVDIQDRLHFVVNVNDPGEVDEFGNQLDYYKTDINLGVLESAVITNNQLDVASGRRPVDGLDSDVYASRILSFSGNSISMLLYYNYMIDGFTPIVTYIDRVENKPLNDGVSVPWEVYTQGYVAYKSGSSWIINAISDKQVRPYSEVKNISVSDSFRKNVSLTVVDNVTKQHVDERYLDAIGQKSCVVAVNSLLLYGGVPNPKPCGDNTQFTYIQPNGGEWVTGIQPIRP